MVNPQPRHGQQLVGLFRDLSEQEDLLIMIQDTGGNAPAQVLAPSNAGVRTGDQLETRIAGITSTRLVRC